MHVKTSKKEKKKILKTEKKFFAKSFFKYYLCLGFDDIIWKTLTRSRRSLFGKSMNQFFRSKKTQMLQLNTSQFLENKKTIIRVGQVHSQYYDKKGKKIVENKNLSISDFFFDKNRTFEIVSYLSKISGSVFHMQQILNLTITSVFNRRTVGVIFEFFQQFFMLFNGSQMSHERLQQFVQLRLGFWMPLDDQFDHLSDFIQHGFVLKVTGKPDHPLR